MRAAAGGHRVAHCDAYVKGEIVVTIIIIVVIVICSYCAIYGLTHPDEW